MIVFRPAADAVSVVHPVNPSLRKVVQRQTIFYPLRPMLRGGDDPGFDFDHASADQPELGAAQAEQELQFMVGVC